MTRLEAIDLLDLCLSQVVQPLHDRLAHLAGKHVGVLLLTEVGQVLELTEDPSSE